MILMGSPWDCYDFWAMVVVEILGFNQFEKILLGQLGIFMGFLGVLVPVVLIFV